MRSWSLHHGRIGEGQRLSVELAGGDRVLQRLAPGLQLEPVERAVGHLAGQRRREEGESRGLDRGMSVNSCSARSAAQIRPPGLARRSTIRPVWRQQPEQPDQLGDERVVVVDVERPDPQIADLPAEGLRGQHVLHRRVEPLADLRRVRDLGDVRRS